jgi:protein-tyrosine phosphatase
LHFESASEFIDSKTKSKKNVLVQCHGGASRSVTLILAYLMKIKRLTLEEAFQLVKGKRHRAKPNIGFWKQLEELNAELHKPKT